VHLRAVVAGANTLLSWSFCSTPRRAIDNAAVSPECARDEQRVELGAKPAVELRIPSDACKRFGSETYDTVRGVLEEAREHQTVSWFVSAGAVTPELSEVNGTLAEACRVCAIGAGLSCVMDGGVIDSGLEGRSVMSLVPATLTNLPAAGRAPEGEVDRIFVERWSRRAISERPLSDRQIATLFEAARWAPSANNLQPWLFVYANRAESLARARALLKDTNQRWAARAPLLVFVFARKRNAETGASIRTAQFDTGAAWQSLALQAHKLGLSTRAMGGIHHHLTYGTFGVPADEFESMAAIAVGYPDTREVLPEELHAREQPSARKSVREFVFEGTYR
jgi:nitroreductase